MIIHVANLKCIFIACVVDLKRNALFDGVHEFISGNSFSEISNL